LCVLVIVVIITSATVVLTKTETKEELVKMHVKDINLQPTEAPSPWKFQYSHWWDNDYTNDNVSSSSSVHFNTEDGRSLHIQVKKFYTINASVESYGNNEYNYLYNRYHEVYFVSLGHEGFYSILNRAGVVVFRKANILTSIWLRVDYDQTVDVDTLVQCAQVIDHKMRYYD
jgi:hypothetical protein